MTDDRIALRELLEKGSDATFLREMIGFAAQRLMELETDGLCGAADNCTAVAKAAEILGGEETEAAEVAHRASLLAVPLCTDCLSSILDHDQAVFVGDL